ncbi:PTS sugar transporter subunit IIA [Thalassoglobus sp. JC818]|uniref:PTS sugar transporter subunit IIA n=1 Tax=Thalassoglobus sp. JC818 TaxID=3232136 RepID=UPI0034595238
MKSLYKTFSNPDTCLLDLSASTIESAFEQTIRHLVECKLIAPAAEAQIVEGLVHREKTSSTAIGHSLSTPHYYDDSMIDQMVVFVRLHDALNLGAPDHLATRYLFILLGPRSATSDHLDTLALIVKLMSDHDFRYDLSVAESPDDLKAAMEQSIERSRPTTITPKQIPDGLTRTGRFGGGMIGDLKRRLPYYWSDFRDGMNAKSIASVLFLYFACLAPTVTFGGVMSAETGGAMGAVEMITTTALCGIVYAIFSGQPLIILGGTGPLLVFTAILYELCQQFQVPFLPTFFWVGLWTSMLTILFALTDAGCLMRYFTRFTDEIFAALISFIFIYKALESLIAIFNDLDVNQHHDTALLSLLLALGTFYIAITLQGMRRSRYMLPWMREFLADFGPTIALAAMTLVAFRLHEVDLDVLPAPDRWETTNGRSWLVDPFAVPLWVRFAALGPALVGSILVFLDQNITARLVNATDNQLKKGSAYHWDLALVGMLIGVCSTFGLPWTVAATVRSLNHVRSLATIEESVGSGGERRDRILRVRENRITGLAIHLMIGASLLLLPLLKNIPMAVLYGLFLFMGIVSMRGNQFFERLSLWTMEPSLYPATHYTRRVPISMVHLFSLIQLVCLLVLWTVKESPLGILFPLFIAMLVPIRISLDAIFKPAYLDALDADEIPETEETHWT